LRISRILLRICCLLLLLIPAAAQQVRRDAYVIYETRHDVSLPARDLARMAPAPRPGILEMREHQSPKRITQIDRVDPVGQDVYLPGVRTTNLLSFDAITGAQGGAIPPDTNGSVGSTQYVLTVNLDYAVYDKATGTQLLAPTRLNTIWSGFGGLCQTVAGGDPIVLWDKPARRWFISELAYNGGFTQNFLCAAVSTSEDATGTYNRYAFAFGSTLPDYPHYSVWPDAYYVGVNAFGAGWGEPCALNRAAMLAGSAATIVCFPATPPNMGYLPSDLDGATLPPAGAPGHFVEIGNNTTSLNEFDFHVDFVTPANSTFTGPHVITVPSFTLLCGGGGGACIHQPSPGSLLDALGDRLMHRLAYRNFGDHESMVVGHSVRPTRGNAEAAMRWYELRATPPGSTFTLFQTGTFQNRTISLWMGSVGMDKMGNIAMGMSAVNTTNVKPTIVYTGRNAADPLGQMQAPFVVVRGTGVQTGTNRWGDYSSMSIDPADDCTFYYTTEYYKTNGTNWISHINSFRFTDCQ
jgi:hypothetical protein